jgi:hypothetical protein
MTRSSTLVLFFFGVTAAGCAADASAPVGESKQAIVSDQLVVVDAGAAVEVAPDRLVFRAPVPGAVRAARPGALLVSSAGQGFLRGVVSLLDDGGTVTIATRQATLEEAIVEGGTQASAQLGAKSAPGIHTDLTFAVTPFDYALGPIDVAPSLTLQPSGDVQFHPDVDIELQIHGGQVSLFRAALTADLDVNADLQVAAAAALTAGTSVTLASTPPVVLTQWIGPVPVVETVTVTLVASAYASTTASATLDFGTTTLHAGLTAGAQYTSRGGWQPIYQPSVTFDHAAPSLTPQVTAGAQLALDLRAQVLLYGVAGPYVQVGPYVRAQVTAPPPAAATRVGLQGSFGGELQVLGRTVASFDQPLFDVGKDF